MKCMLLFADWKSRGEPEFIDAITDGGEANIPGVPPAEGAEGDGEQDALFDEAVAFVTQTRKVSISSVQRKLRIGYNRAARLVETMEEAGVVSEPGHNGSREVLAPPPCVLIVKMESILKKVSVLFAAFLFLFSINATAIDAQDLSSYLKQLNNLTARFVQHTHDGQGSLLQTQTGKIYLQHTNKFRWESEPPFETAFVNEWFNALAIRSRS